MENSKNKKNSKAQQNNDTIGFVHALRSSGMLLPVTEDEVKAFKELYGELSEELPDKFKNLDFVFIKSDRNNISEISLKSEAPSEEIKLAYAARDGQEKLPDHILNKMHELKNKSKEKKSRSSKG